MSSLRYTSLGVMRPPKPPCWRDFVVSSPKSINSDGVEIQDTSGRALGSRSPVADLMETSRAPVSLPGNKPSRLVRRPRARIHRTRSEHVIHAEDLPESAFTATLADTDPKGLRVRNPEGRLYVEENNRRCQNWLAGIVAAEPLDVVAYTIDKQQEISQANQRHIQIENLNNKSTGDLDTRLSEHVEKNSIPIYDLQQGVDVEIPEEAFVWDVSGKTRHPSQSSDEEMSSTCKDVVSQQGCEVASGIVPICSHTVSSTRSQVSPVRSPVSPTSSEVSPTPCTREPTDNTSKTRHGDGHDTCKSATSNYTAKTPKYDKNVVDTKLHKLCCDIDYTYSSSGTDNDSSRCLVAFDGCGKNQVTCSDIQEGNASPKDSSCSLSQSYSRSSSQRSTARRLLNDSELWALNLSTCD